MTSAINWNELNARLGGEPGFVSELLGVVATSNVNVPGALREAARNVDWPALERLAHRTKGTAGDIVATACHELARTTELAARARDPQAPGLALQLAEALELVLEEIRAHLAG